MYTAVDDLFQSKTTSPEIFNLQKFKFKFKKKKKVNISQNSHRYTMYKNKHSNLALKIQIHNAVLWPHHPFQHYIQPSETLFGSVTYWG